MFKITHKKLYDSGIISASFFFDKLDGTGFEDGEQKFKDEKEFLNYYDWNQSFCFLVNLELYITLAREKFTEPGYSNKERMASLNRCQDFLTYSCHNRDKAPFREVAAHCMGMTEHIKRLIPDSSDKKDYQRFFIMAGRLIGYCKETLDKLNKK
jgi:hypothetical protein